MSDYIYIYCNFSDKSITFKEVSFANYIYLEICFIFWSKNSLVKKHYSEKNPLELIFLTQKCGKTFLLFSNFSKSYFVKFQVTTSASYKLLSSWTLETKLTSLISCKLRSVLFHSFSNKSSYFPGHLCFLTIIFGFLSIFNSLN